MLEHAVYAIGTSCRSEQDCAQQLLNRLQRAINQRNWALFSECFTEDVLLVNLLGQRLTGRAELTSYLQQLMELHQDRVWVYQLLHLQQLDLDTFLINAEQKKATQSWTVQHSALCSEAPGQPMADLCW